jgi:hypothetical protein
VLIPLNPHTAKLKAVYYVFLIDVSTFACNRLMNF